MENELELFLIEIVQYFDLQKRKSVGLRKMATKANFLLEQVIYNTKPLPILSNSNQNEVCKVNLKNYNVNKLPNEILNLIFERFKVKDETSNFPLLNLALVNKKWSTVALPLLYRDLYTRHDSVSKLYTLAKCLKLNSIYRESHTNWFNPFISSLTFYSTSKTRSDLNQDICKKLLKIIASYAKHLMSFILIIEQMSGYDVLNFNLNDLNDLFTSCQYITHLDINKLTNTWDIKPIEKGSNLKNSFLKLKTLCIMSMEGGNDEYASLFSNFPPTSIEVLEIPDLTMETAESLKDCLKNLYSLTLTGNLYNEPGEFKENVANLVFQKATNLKKLNSYFHLSEAMFNIMIKCKVSLKYLKCTIFGKQVDPLSYCSWETGLKVYFKSLGNHLTELYLTLIESKENELDDSKLDFFSNHLKNLEIFSYKVYKNINEDYQEVSPFANVSESAVTKFCFSMKKLKRVAFRNKIKPTRTDLKEVFKSYGIRLVDVF
ncbi:hypothetical protein HK099_008684 [Clydaea vesicula]|uniref:F-box domain-containing protein n=1 Tax=Clydaea vesicula TaxID=447962 RepID=A0AAD5TV39_9FUNG|nr:hypothetical protein HK099_008684 [Clydaea vesicula]